MVNNQSDKKLDKVYCPKKQCIKYVSACESLCRFKVRCSSLKEYYSPLLWKS